MRFAVPSSVARPASMASARFRVRRATVAHTSMTNRPDGRSHQSFAQASLGRPPVHGRSTLPRLGRQQSRNTRAHLGHLRLQLRVASFHSFTKAG